MTQKKTLLGFLVGRFNPLHAGHRDLIRQAASESESLLVLIGSANSPRTIKNPFTFHERENAILQFLNHEGINNVYIYPLNDYKYSDSQWLSDVSSIIEENRQFFPDSSVTMFGYMKDGNEYLKMFPQYKFRNIKTKYEICSSDIRKDWFDNARHNFDPDVVADYDYFKKEKELFKNYPFPETLNFNCGDVIVECSGHVLLIQRKHAPGKNSWALPGGFKNSNETFIDCAIRELFEETNIRIPEKVIRGSIINTRLFDAVDRGMGLPRTTLAVHIKVGLDADGDLPRAKGADDAITCQWFPIDHILNNMQLFDDHSGIISVMCGTMPVPAHKNPKFRFQN